MWLERKCETGSMQYFVGVDGGGSNTRAVVVSETLEVIGQGASGASNHYVAGTEQASLNCRLAVDAALIDSRRIVPKFNSDEIASFGFGLAGVRRETDAAPMRIQLRDLFPNQPFILDTDVAAAHAGAFSGGPGIVLSAGTGAIAMGIDARGDRYHADGWGPLMGDEGSGYWLGQEALRAVVRDVDGRGPKTRLTSTVLHALGVVNADALVQTVHSPNCTREHIAGLARLVLEAADAGGQVAISIRDRAVSHLSISVAAVAHAMLSKVQERLIAGEAVPPLDLPVALRGGLFEDDFLRASVGYNIGERMIDLKRDFLPIGSWKVVKPQYDARVGAALLGRSGV